MTYSPLCPQARAVLCREDLKEIVILPHGVSTRASAEGEGSGFLIGGGGVFSCQSCGYKRGVFDAELDT